MVKDKFLRFGATVSYKTRWLNYASMSKCFVDRKHFDNWLAKRKFKVIGVFTYDALIELAEPMSREMLLHVAQTEARSDCKATQSLITFSEVHTNCSGDMWICINRVGEQFTLLVRDNTLTKWDTTKRVQIPIYKCKQITAICH